jgi:hypothetical protein
MAANILFERSTLAQFDGRFEEARRLILEAQSVLGESGDEMRYIAVGGRMATIEIAADDPDAAIRILRASRQGLADLGEYGFRSSLTADLADAL